jgi:hypothetical protein
MLSIKENPMLHANLFRLSAIYFETAVCAQPQAENGALFGGNALQ